eukprot:CAMPEP_0196732566 /NCGR_PEP_ID=MMETSP1091-20130531/11938_1 /TAXON_ID=302021 /ORGANISM="Rhodomonas sp., Strain CCMP768" /LENGTH=617 /DNA_ID=CAMNT_0042075859 /DNA_START=32 /DNA_END=1886 /DNA_ORIENTATION=+
MPCHCLVLHDNHPGEEASNHALRLKSFLEHRSVVTRTTTAKDGPENMDCAMVLVLVSKGLVNCANDRSTSVHSVCDEIRCRFQNETLKVLAVVVDEDCQAPKTWGDALRFLGDYFYANICSGDAGTLEGLFSKICQALDLRTKCFYITMRKTPDWRSYVQADSPNLDGFGLEGSCGARGVFEAYTSEMPGTVRFQVENAVWWASTTKTNVLQLEWRIFRAGSGAGKKFLVTSNRADTAPGWSFVEVFYAPGSPSNGCNQSPSHLIPGAAISSEKRFQCFLSHNWKPPADNHARVVAVGAHLKAAGLVPWIDQDRLDMSKYEHIHHQLKNGIDQSAVVVVFITKAYVEACESGDEFDNCYREFVHYRARHYEGAVSLLPVVSEPALRDTSSWGCLRELFSVEQVERACEMLASTDDAAKVQAEHSKLSSMLAAPAMLGIKTGRFFVTGRKDPDWRSYVQRDAPFERDGFSARFASCGAGGAFVAYTAPVIGAVKMRTIEGGGGGQAGRSAGGDVLGSRREDRRRSAGVAVLPGRRQVPPHLQPPRHGTRVDVQALLLRSRGSKQRLRSAAVSWLPRDLIGSQQHCPSTIWASGPRNLWARAGGGYQGAKLSAMLEVGT